MAQDIDITFRIKNAAKEEIEKLKKDLRAIGPAANDSLSKTAKDFSNLGFAIFDVSKQSAKTKQYFEDLKKSQEGLSEETQKTAKSMDRVGEEAEQAGKKIKKYGDDVEDTERKSKSMDSSTAKLLTSFKKMSLAVAAAVGINEIKNATIGAIKGYTSLDDTLRRTASIIDATDEQFKGLKVTTNELAMSTKVGSQEISSAMQTLGQAGFTYTEIMEGIPEVVTLSKAGGVGLEQAASIASSMIRSYGLEVSQLVKVNDELAMAANKTDAEVSEIGEAFSYVGPIAKGVGVDFEDLVSSIGILHNAGLKGSRAGTALVGTISALMNPTKQEAELMEDLGKRIGQASINVRNADGTFVGFEAVVKQLEAAGLDGAEALELFGDRAGPGVSALITIGSKAIGELSTELSNTSGKAKQVADDMDAGIGGKFRELTAISDSLRTAMVAAFEGDIIEVIEFLTKQVVSMKESFLQFKEDGSLEQWGNATVKIIKFVTAAIQGLFALLSDTTRPGKALLLAITGDFEGAAKQIMGFGKSTGKFIAEVAGATDDLKRSASGAVIETRKINKVTGEVLDETVKKVDEAAKKIGRPKGKPTNFVKNVLGDSEEDKKAIKEKEEVIEQGIKSNLDLVKKSLETEREKLDLDYEQKLISLDKYYEERKRIVSNRINAEIATVSKLASLESDPSEKQKLIGEAKVLGEQLNAELYKIDGEKYKTQDKISKENLKSQEEINKLRLKAEEAFQNQKERILIDYSTGLGPVFTKELTDLQEKQNAELAAIQEFHSKKMQLLIDQKASEKEVEQSAYEQAQALSQIRTLQEEEKTKLLQDQQLRMTEFRLNNIAMVAEAASQVFANAYKMMGSKNKELFYAAKAAAIAEATIKGALAIQTAWSQGGFYGGFMAAFVAAQTALQIATFASQSLAEGGIVKGSSPNKKADDKIIHATSGEFMQPVDSVKYYGLDVMEGIRRRSIPKEALKGFYVPSIKYGTSHFATGGMVTSTTPVERQKKEPQTNIINVMDPKVFDQWAFSASGQRNVLNILSENIFELRQMVFQNQ